jgi:uncharacterized protein (TIGR02147 family)
MDIFDYSDYRQLLSDLYAERKRTDPHFSYRFIATHAGFKSPSFFAQIMQGKTNISIKTALSLGAVFKLKSHELEYFENLVHFSQAKTPADKRHFFDRIIALKRGKPKTLEENQYEFFTNWYYLAVRELLGFFPFKGDYKELGEALVPKISPTEAKEAVKVLVRLGLVQKTAAGKYEKMDATLSTGDHWKSEAITQFQMACLDLAKESFHSQDPKLWDHSTLTLSLSASDFRRIREELMKVRKKILEMAKTSPVPDRIYHINFNIFPMSRINEN